MRSISFSNFILWIFSKKPTVHFWGRPLLRRTTFVRWPQTKTGWLTCGGCASRPRRPALRGQRRQRAFAAEAAQPRRTMLIRRRRTKTGYLAGLRSLSSRSWRRPALRVQRRQTLVLRTHISGAALGSPITTDESQISFPNWSHLRLSLHLISLIIGCKTECKTYSGILLPLFKAWIHFYLCILLQADILKSCSFFASMPQYFTEQNL